MEAAAPWHLCKLFIGGLSAQTTTEVLRAHFAKYGRIMDAVVMSKQGRPRGFGFVTFESPGGAAAALAAPQWLDGRYVDVKRAVPGEQAEECPNKIFVGGLPQDAATEDLKAYFQHYGPIVDAVVMVDRRSKRSRGFGFIRFANGVQGERAAEAVMIDAANHRLGGKWVEVKRATPAALVQQEQEFSPKSVASMSTMTSTPTYRHHQLAWDGMWGGLDVPGEEEDRCGFNMGLWGHSAIPVSLGSLCRSAVGWGHGVDLTSMLPPVHPYAGGHVALDSGLLGRASHVRSLGAQFEDAETGIDTLEVSCSISSDSDGENKPAAANRAVTPPPAGLKKRSLIRPPGLGIEASPMKVECCSRSLESMVGRERLGMAAYEDSLCKAQPGLSAW